MLWIPQSVIFSPNAGVGAYGWIPDEELGLQGVDRADDAKPSKIWGNKTNGPLPTNSWYLVSYDG
jgi:hypothetical protein